MRTEEEELHQNTGLGYLTRVRFGNRVGVKRITSSDHRNASYADIAISLHIQISRRQYLEQKPSHRFSPRPDFAFSQIHLCNALSCTAISAERRRALADGAAMQKNKDILTASDS